MSVLPSGAPSHTTRSAGWPSKWRIISWAVDTWEEEGDRSCEVSSPPQIPLEFYESYMLIPDVFTFVMSPWICVTPGSGAMACRSTATIFTSSPPSPFSPFSSRPLSAKTNQGIIKKVEFKCRAAQICYLVVMNFNSCVVTLLDVFYPVDYIYVHLKKQKKQNLSFRLRTWLQLPGAAQRSTALFTPVREK